MLEEKEIINKDEIIYALKLRMAISPEKIIEMSIKATGKLIANDYKELLKQIEKNQKKFDKLKKESRKTNPLSKLQELEKEFQGLLFFDKGFGHFLKREYADAVKQFAKSIEINSSLIYSYEYRAKSFRLSGNSEAAIQDYKRIIDINPSNENAHYNLGTLFVEKAEDDLAITHLTKAIMLTPDFAEAYKNRGTAYSHKKQYDLAIEDFTKSISLNSNDPTTFHNRGYVLFKKGDYKAAIKDATKAIELSPDYVEAYCS